MGKTTVAVSVAHALVREFSGAATPAGEYLIRAEVKGMCSSWWLQV
jgi:hypothetical protein